MILSTLYEVGKYVKPHDAYDPNIEIICASGIHYFLTAKAALSYDFWYGRCSVYEKDVTKKYDDNGNITITKH